MTAARPAPFSTPEPPATDQDYRRPSRALFRAEGARAVAELAQFWAAFPCLALGPGGDGHTVLVLPGFCADDSSTRPLRILLAARGYRPEAWRLGVNLGPTDRVIDALDDRVERLAAERGPVTLIGWSLGGIYARGLAKQHPTAVRRVVTLGAPLRIVGIEDDRHVTHAGPLYHALRRHHSVRPWVTDDYAPPPVPSTSIYSHTDGVVPWEACLEYDGPLATSALVPGSHCGLGHNVPAARLILRLLQEVHPN